MYEQVQSVTVKRGGNYQWQRRRPFLSVPDTVDRLLSGDQSGVSPPVTHESITPSSSSGEELVPGRQFLYTRSLQPAVLEVPMASVVVND